MVHCCAVRKKHTVDVRKKHTVDMRKKHTVDMRKEPTVAPSPLRETPEADYAVISDRPSPGNIDLKENAAYSYVENFKIVA